jgi:hypothetical protein
MQHIIGNAAGMRTCWSARYRREEQRVAEDHHPAGQQARADPEPDPGPFGPVELVAVPYPDGLRPGRAWILDGLQITVASSVSGELTEPSTLGMTSTQVGLIAWVYLVGEMVGDARRDAAAAASPSCRSDIAAT